MANITKRTNKSGEASYLIRVFVDEKFDGSQSVKSMTYKPEPGMTERQIEKKLNETAVLFEKKVKQGLIDENIKFGEYAKKWLETNKSNHAPITHTRYKNLLVRIDEALGHIKIGKLQSMHLNEFYKNLQEITSQKTGEKLTPQTIKHYHRLISSILTQATRERIIPNNVASRQFMNAPKVQKKAPAHLNDEQAKQFVSLLNNESDIRIKTAFTLLIYSGCRLGELCGFTWADCDFKACTITVNQTSQYCHGYGIIEKSPKNETSKRTIKLSQYVFNILSEYRIWYLKRKIECGDKWIDSDKLFTQEFGKPIMPTLINKWLNNFTLKHNLPKISPHSLRHTNITLMISAGVDVRTVASKAGHSRTSTTLDIYSHALQAYDEKATVVIDEILTPQLKRA